MAGGLDTKQKRTVKESLGAVKFMGGVLLIPGFTLAIIGYACSTSQNISGYGLLMLITGIIVLIIGFLSVFFAHRAKGTLVDAEILPL